MIKEYLKDLFTTFLSIVPIVLLVLLFHFTGLNVLDGNELTLFLLGSLFMLFGSSLFTHFAEISMTEIGSEIGNSLSKSKNIQFIIVVAFLLGFIFTIAEPDLRILADQTPLDSYTFVIIVAAGVGIMFILGTLRILLNLNLRIILLLCYGITFMLCLLINDPSENIPIIFDAGGSVTGSISVPLILAIGIGLSSRKSNSKENATFGLSGIISLGPLLIMAIMFIFVKSGNSSVDKPVDTSNIGSVIGGYFLSSLTESLIAVAPIIGFYILYGLFILKLKFKQIFKTLTGFIIIIVGLILFLAGANIGFLTIGQTIGKNFAINETSGNNGIIWMLVFVTITGLIIAFAEPSIKILSKDIEDMSEGSIKKRNILIALSISIALAILASFLRIIYKFDLVYILIPGYILVFIFMFLVDDKYIGIAFDSGAVCSGTLTAAFILPIAIGFATGMNYSEQDIVSSSFGILSLVAMVPILTIEFIGMQSKVKQKLAYKKARERNKPDNDNEIIYFD